MKLFSQAHDYIFSETRVDIDIRLRGCDGKDGCDV